MKFFKSGNNGAESQITFYDGINRAENGKKLSAAKIKRSTMQTVNLCKREKKGMSFAMFCLLLFIILAILILVEFFAAYRPYKQMEAKQQELSEKQDRLDSLYGAMTDRKEVQDEYREYHYDDFPDELRNRKDILTLFETKIFPYGTVSSLSVTAANSTSITITDIDRNYVETFKTSLREDELVESVSFATVKMLDNGKAQFSFVIRFKPAEKGGNW